MNVVAIKRVKTWLGTFVCPVFPRLLALSLILVALVPSLSHADIDAAESHARLHSVALIAAPDPAPTQGHNGCCCIDSLQYGWYRHVEVDDAWAIVRLPDRHPAYAVSDEAGRSLNADPFRKPPRV